MIPRVAVIMGGYTSEHNISMKSGAVVMAHIDRDAYEVYAVHIDKDVWLVEINGNWKPIDISDFSCDEIKFDVVFNAVHGAPGENGEIQKYFDSLGIPYTGCSAQLSSLTYNKYKTLEFLEPHGIAMAKRIVLTAKDTINTDEIVSTLGLPCFVKANQAGSSFGVSKVHKKEDLSKAIEFALKEDNTILIESFLEGIDKGYAISTVARWLQVEKDCPLSIHTLRHQLKDTHDVKSR